MHFRWDSDVEAFRDEVRDFLRSAMTPELEERIYRTGVSHDPEFARGLAAKGWLAPPSPGAADGQCGPIQAHVVKEELMRADAPVYLVETTRMVAAIIGKIGSARLRGSVLPAAAAGEITIALGFTEPECGSDVAAATTKAVRSGEDWIINGSKMFTTNGHIADYVFLLTRTNPAVAKHKGLTTFLVPMNTPGVEAQGVWTLSGERTNITFYSDVRVGDEWRIGEVDGGWHVMNLSLDDEHSSGWGPHIARLLTISERWASEHDDTAAPRLQDRDVRRRLARAATELEVATLLQRRCVWMAEQGSAPLAEGSMSKLFSTEALERATEDIFEMIGPDAARSYFDPTALAGGRFEHLMRFSLGTTIYAGTSEVQRNIIAQRGLGLPR
ncbi:acyl-CoA dehydrogenase family protein [Nocardia vaccinii]|uniref:acyl-CoA dehydrogenase family protein n=1 Tax=Nocardia vaccinii TaxID=1822 RepID=UPI00082FD603|nr:acyl-CoA dehydrogenase family protein [Nocardia vaccinii]